MSNCLGCLSCCIFLILSRQGVDCRETLSLLSFIITSLLVPVLVVYPYQAAAESQYLAEGDEH